MSRRGGLFARRRAGVLLHPSSLPGRGPVGVLGAEARRFVDYLADVGFSVWHTLPLGPVDALGSPYRPSSAFAGDIRLIDTHALDRLADIPAGLPGDLLHDDPRGLYATFDKQADDAHRARFSEFMRGNRDWLLPFTAFEHCSARFDEAPWWLWPAGFRKRRSQCRLVFRSGAGDQKSAAVSVG